VPNGITTLDSPRRENGSNNRARPSGEMIGPPSRTANRNHAAPAVCSSPAMTRTSPGAANFTALESRLIST
jgi:hypothetical protein